MKSRIFSVLGLVLLFSVFSLQAYAQQFEIIQITDGTQKFRKPVWSPDGTKLAFWGPGGIYVAKADGTELPRKIFDTFGEDLMWASDSELVYWQRKIIKIKQEGKKPRRENKESVRVVTLNGSERVIKEAPSLSILVQLHDGTIGFWEPDAVTGTFNMVSKGRIGKIDPSKLLTVTSHYPPVYSSATKRSKYEDTDIWITSFDGSFKKRVTYGKQFEFPQLSPDKTKILVQKPPHADIVILDLDGNEIVDLEVGVKEISPGLFIGVPASKVKWSPNTNQLVCILEIDDGEQVKNSDLYLMKSDGTEKLQLTNTPNDTEMDPVWSPDGSAIAYYTENTGKIFVLKF